MPFDPVVAAGRLRADALELRPPAGGWPAGALARDFTRSPAAMRVGRLAAEAGLFLFHHEHRAHLPLPEDFVPEGREDLAEPPAWDHGVLPERKYQAFRHDLPIGGMNPGHRAKWTTHELCHGLVGFAWRLDATPFFHACAGRLAELLPVALWYFFDEVHLRRCPAHAEFGALFGDLCGACEAIAAAAPEDPHAAERLEDGRRFVDRELAALAKSRRLGRPIPHPWATIDLCSDGVAYADAHGARLQSDAFADFAARFLVEDGGWTSSLDALEARVLAVAQGILGEADPPLLAPSPTHGRWRWTLQDIAWRLLTIAHETEGEAREALEALIEDLGEAADVARAPGPADHVEAVAAWAVEHVASEYAALVDEVVLPDAADVFAVGYPLPGGHGTSARQLAEGIASATPSAVAHLTDLPGLTARFAADDAPIRAPLAERWSAWLSEAEPGPAAEVARYEAALRHPPAGDRGVARALGWDGSEGRRLSDNVRLHAFTVDVVALADDPSADPGDPVTLAIGRDGRSDVLIVDLTPETAAAIAENAPLDPDDARALEDLGVLAPLAWSETQD